MLPVVVPQEDVNSETATLVRWLAADESLVYKNQPLCEVESTKAVFEVRAPADGWLVHAAQPGDEMPFNSQIALIVESTDELSAAREQLRSDSENGSGQRQTAAGSFPGKLTQRARELVEKHRIPLGSLPNKAILTERDVLPLIEAAEVRFSPLDQHRPAAELASVLLQRTLVLGAGLGAMQVVDILAHDPRVQVVGYIDDNAELHGASIYGLPILGGCDRIEELLRAGEFDAAIISVSTSIALRRRWYDLLKALRVPLVNAIDPTAKINRGVVLGEGNVICAGVHVGVETRIGNNCFLSAYTSIDHHNIWGSHITTGPGIMTSGCVQVEDEVKMGTGIFIQPHLTIGRRAVIASGAVLTRSVPTAHIVKTHLNVEIVPLPEPEPGAHSGRESHEP